MDIADIATTEHATIGHDERLGRVRATFERENPQGIVVTDENGYAGVITERALLQSHVEDSTKVEALMTDAPQVERTDDLREVARVLVEGRTRIAPVFEANEFWGVVTGDAILEAVLDNLDALTVEQIHTEEAITINEDDRIGQAINLLREHGVSRLPTMNDRGQLAGIVTTHDIADFVIRSMDQPTEGERVGDSDRMLDLPVRDLASSPVATIGVEASVREAVSLMLENDYDGLVVTPTDNDSAVRGVLTKTDVLRALTFTEEEHMDVQITNIGLLDTITREEIRESVTEVADKHSGMQVQHAHVRFHKHKEKLRGTPLIQSQIRLRTDQGQVAGTGEGYGAESAFRVALDKLERNVLEEKGIQNDAERRGQLLRKLNEI